MTRKHERRHGSGSQAIAERDIPFEAFIEAVRDYAIFMLDVDGHVTSWNVGAERLKGYRADEIIGQHFSVFYPPEDRAAGKPAAMLATAAANGRVEDEGWRLRKDGRRFWADVVITAVCDRDRNLIGFAKVTRDMTEGHARRAALEATNQELRRANEALEMFTRSMTHDITSPLRTICGFAEILLEDYGPTLDREGRDYLTRIAGGADRLADLVQGLLTLSRITRSGDMPVLSRVSLDDVTHEVARDLQGDVERRSASIHVAAPLGDVLAHRPFLVIVLQNLLRNGMTFVAEGVHPRVSVATSRHDGVVRLTVADNGIGIPVAERETVFQPFARLHPRAAFEGSGLGLAIVKNAVERMGGACGVESAPGSGSRFWVDLQAAD